MSAGQGVVDCAAFWGWSRAWPEWAARLHSDAEARNAILERWGSYYFFFLQHLVALGSRPAPGPEAGGYVLGEVEHFGHTWLARVGPDLLPLVRMRRDVRVARVRGAEYWSKPSVG